MATEDQMLETRGYKLRRGWNQEKESKKSEDRTRERNKKAQEARSKIGQVMQLAASHTARTATALNTGQQAVTQTMNQAAQFAILAKVVKDQQRMKAKNKAGGGGGKGLAGKLAGAKNINQLARRIENAGYNVGGLEGFEGQGEITSGHVDNSYHYRGTGMDITGDRLKKLYNALYKVYGDSPLLKELFLRKRLWANGHWIEPGDPDYDRLWKSHLTHVHLALARRKKI